MFIGHFAAAFAAKKADRKLSLGATFVAAQWLDLLWPVLLLTGIEHAEITTDAAAPLPLQYTDYPVSHSLLAVAGWSLLMGFPCPGGSCITNPAALPQSCKTCCKGHHCHGHGFQQMLAGGHPPVVLCSPQIRLGFKRFFESTFAELAVLSYAEIPARVEVHSAGVVPPLES